MKEYQYDSPEVVEARKYFDEMWGDYSHEVTLVGFLNEKGGFNIASNTACHAAMSYGNSMARHEHSMGSYGDTGKHVCAIISGFQCPETGEDWDHYGITNDDLLRFASYMLYESPYGSIFFNPSAEDVVHNHWLISGNAPQNLAGAGAMATRLPSEYPTRFVVWRDLVKAGVDANRAFFWVWHLDMQEGNGYYWASTYGHCPHPGDFDKDFMTNFLSSNVVGGGEPFYQEGRYKWRHGTFSAGKSPKKFSAGKFSDIIVGGADVVKLDIFLKPVKNMGSAVYKNVNDLAEAINIAEKRVNA